MTEKQCYDNLKKLNKKYPDIFMDADKWLSLRRKLKKNENPSCCS